MGDLNSLLVLGLVLALGLASSKLAAWLRTPQILGGLLLGLAIGPELLRLLNKERLDHLQIIIPFTMSLIGFGIGSELQLDLLKKLGRSIALIAFAESAATFVLVGAAVWLAGPRHALPLALLLASLAVASAPTTTAAVLQELRAAGPLTTTVLAVIGIDVVIGLVAFAVALPLSLSLAGGNRGPGALDVLRATGWEIAVSPLAGLALGWLLTVAVKRLRTRGDVLIVTLAMLFLAAGIAQWAHLSLLMISLVAGMTLANRNRILANRVREGLTHWVPPIYLVFFVLVGALTQPSHVKALGLVGVGYIVARSLAKWAGCWVGGWASGADPAVRRLVGLGLLNQAGVATGLALSAYDRLKQAGPATGELGAQILSVIAGSTLVLFILAPPAIKYAIQRSGEAGQARF